MTDESAPRFSLWFRAWWLALLGAVVAVGGAVVWLVTRLATAVSTFGTFSYRPLPSTAYRSQLATTLTFSPVLEFLHVAGAVLFIAGLVTVAAAVGYRLGRARS
jgi:hypothetical protein